MNHVKISFNSPKVKLFDKYVSVPVRRKVFLKPYFCLITLKVICQIKDQWNNVIDECVRFQQSWSKTGLFITIDKRPGSLLNTQKVSV